jgi:tRNA pseudouridine55 synthase
VRTLISELGDAYCTALRRTAIGSFSVADAEPEPALERLVPIDDALGHLPAVELGDDEARRAGHGVAVPAPGGAEDLGETVRLRGADGLIALAEPRDGGLLKPVVGFTG